MWSFLANFCPILLKEEGEAYNLRRFLWKTMSMNTEGSWKLNIHILLYRDNSWTIALRQMKFGTVKDHRHIYKFFWGKDFKYMIVSNVEVMLEQTLRHST
jgi:hypothetical protein